MASWKSTVVPILLHLMIIFSVFDIYFKSPIVKVPEPPPPKFEAPARRLVLFVADGLRAESFYAPNAAPFLHETGYRKGAIGLSHTQVPTESRPGHVAMLAGLYEDPSAITKGWTENPVDFDSVLNRSTNAWAWGSPDILPMFAKGSAGSRVNTASYDSSFEDFAAQDSSHLDTWVFEKVAKFFEDALEDHGLQLKLRQQGNVFFLHLLGCDTNGHTNKPGSREYKENIALVDRGVEHMVQVIERYFREDGRTAYVFTADHGMTDWGSHGTGMDHETMTPLVAWGAGIRPRHHHRLQHQSFADFYGGDFANFLRNTEKVDVKQADLAPFMATLIGKNIPTNSVGLLPPDLLDMHPLHLSQALQAQFHQLFNQFKELRHQHAEVHFAAIYHKEFTAASQLQVCESGIEGDLARSEFNKSMKTSLECISLVYKGIEYYHRYQQTLLKILITLTLLLSLASNTALVCQLLNNSCNSPTSSSRSSLGLTKLDIALVGVLTFSWGCQRLPAHFLVYYTAPVYALNRLRSRVADLSITTTQLPSSLTLLLLLAAYGEIIVAAFFDRRWLTLGILLTAGHMTLRSSSNPSKPVLKLALVLLAGVFSWLPPIDGRTQLTELVGLASLLYCGTTYILLRNSNTGLLKHFLALGHLAAGFSVHYSASSSAGLNPVVQLLTWFIFLFTLPLAIFFTNTRQDRVYCLVLGLGSCYTLLSLSYEALFLLSLSSFLLISIQDEEGSRSSTLLGDITRQANQPVLVLRFFFLVFYAFFGTGNIASLNSFDPASIRCFVSVFNPFLMGGLLFAKILIPILTTGILFSSIFKAAELRPELVSAILQLLADFLSLHFFHLVVDKGSWLDIGTSLSHFIIVEGTSLFLQVLLAVSNVLISFRIHHRKFARE